MLNHSLRIISRATFRNYLRIMCNSNLNKYHFAKHFCYTSSYITPHQDHKNHNASTSKKLNDQQHDINKKVFNEANKDENFNNTYVGDVEFKVPTPNLTKDHQQVENEQSVIYPDQSVPTFTSFSDVIANQSQHDHTENDRNESPLNQNLETSTSASASASASASISASTSSSGNLNVTKDQNKNKQNFDKSNVNVGTSSDHDSVQHDKSDPQKKKLMASHDLDLSTGDFEKHLKNYEKKLASSSDQANAMESFAPSKGDYYLKDNNSEYNKHLGNTSNKSDTKNIQKKEEKNIKNDYSLDRDDDLDFEEEPYEQDVNQSNRSKHM